MTAQDLQGECWRWPGAERASDGRPMLRDQYAYRTIYEAVAGRPIPEGAVVHHLCERPWCVNPFHLTPLGRDEHLSEHRPSMRITCRNGHVLGGDNLYEWRGKRYCRACHNANERKRRARARQRQAADRP